MKTLEFGRSKCNLCWTILNFGTSRPRNQKSIGNLGKRSCLPLKIISSFMLKIDGAAAWDVLSKHQEKSGMIGKINTLRKFFTTQFISGSLDNHCANLVTTQKKL